MFYILVILGGLNVYFYASGLGGIWNLIPGIMCLLAAAFEIYPQ